MKFARTLQLLVLGFFIHLSLSAGALANSDTQMKAQLSVNKQQARVGEQIQVRLLISAPIAAFSITHDPVTVLAGKLIPLSRQKYKKTENDVEQQYIDATWALFGTEEQTIEVNPVTVRATLPVSAAGNNATQNPKVAISTEALSLNIKSSDKQQLPWFTATDVKLLSEWPTGTQGLSAGIPITRHLKITAAGQLPAAIPPLTLEPGEGTRVYPGVPELSVTKESQGLTGTRVESMTLMFTRPGTVTLPPVVINWWNSETSAWQQSQLPAETLVVAPGTLQTSNTKPEFFKRLSIVLGLLCCGLIGLCFWLWHRFQTAVAPSVSAAAQTVSEKSAWSTLKSVLHNNNQSDFHTALRQWLKIHKVSREQLEKLDVQLSDDLNALDRNWYAINNESDTPLKIPASLDSLLPGFKQLRRTLRNGEHPLLKNHRSTANQLYPPD